jgi:hypothetical protein
MNHPSKEVPEEIKLFPLCQSKNGIKVTYDPVYSHAATHLEDTPQLKDLVCEVVSNLELDGERVATYFDMDRIVGTCDVVDVDETDEIVYAMRKNRSDDGLVPFVKNREGDPCPFVAMQLDPQPDGSYVLASAWIGTLGDDDEPFPQSPNATERSADFWNRQAFVWGSQEIQDGTLQDQKPW